MCVTLQQFLMIQWATSIRITLVTNKQKTISFAEKCKFWGVKRFIFSSSCSVYGEAVEDIVDENSILNPVSLYAETKCSVEKALIDINSDTFSTTSLRNATAYGHSANLRLDLVINDFVSSAYVHNFIKMLSDGQAYRPLFIVEILPMLLLLPLNLR